MSDTMPLCPSILTCVYCGHHYPAGTPVSGADVQILTDHIKSCEKHPMRELQQDRDHWHAHSQDVEQQNANLRKTIDMLETANASFAEMKIENKRLIAQSCYKDNRLTVLARELDHTKKQYSELTATIDRLQKEYIALDKERNALANKLEDQDDRLKRSSRLLCEAQDTAARTKDAYSAHVDAMQIGLEEQKSALIHAQEDRDDWKRKCMNCSLAMESLEKTLSRERRRRAWTECFCVGIMIWLIAVVFFF